MRNLDNKIEFAIGVTAVVLFASLGYFLNGVKSKSPGEILNMVYQMPRPSNYSAAGFDLSGREVDREYVNPFLKKKADSKDKKADSIKNVNQPLNPSKEAAGKKAQAANKKNDKKKGEVSVSVVEKDENGLSGSAEENFQPAIGSNVKMMAPQTANAEELDNTKKNLDRDNQMSPDQWRSLLAAQPTAKNLNLLVAAFNQKQIDEAAYFTIITDLLSNSKSEVQVLGVYGANAVPSAKSFALLAQAESSLSPEAASQANKVMAGYSKSARQSAIMKVMGSGDSVVVTKAISVLIAGYENAKTEVGGDRGDRGEVSEQALASFLKFVPVLRSLQGSSDSKVSSAANQALGLFNVVAAN